MVLADTNLVLPGSLPSPESLEVYGVSLDFPPAITLADLRVILADSSLELIVNDKPMLQIPLRFLGSGGGVWASLEIDDAAAAATTDDTQAGLGTPGTQDYYRIPVPIVIETKENFRGEVQFSTAIAGLAASRRMTLMLHAIKTRAVQ